MDPRRRSTLSALGLAAFIGGAGVMHFVRPQFFDDVVPDWMPGDPRTTTYVSGVVEIAAGALVALPPTRRLGALLALATFLGVYPANISAAVQGGYAHVEGFGGSALAAWLRLPLQIPMIWWAWRVARSARRATPTRDPLHYRAVASTPYSGNSGRGGRCTPGLAVAREPDLEGENTCLVRTSSPEPARRSAR